MIDIIWVNKRIAPIFEIIKIKLTILFLNFPISTTVLLRFMALHSISKKYLHLFYKEKYCLKCSLLFLRVMGWERESCLLWTALRKEFYVEAAVIKHFLLCPVCQIHSCHNSCLIKILIHKLVGFFAVIHSLDDFPAAVAWSSFN